MTESDQKVFDEDAGAYLPVFSRYKIVLDHGEGPYAYDIDGNKYLDFLGGIAVNVLGHDYPPLVTAIAHQARKMIHCSNLYYTRAQADAAAKLVKLSGLDKAFFGNSGAEANEGAIKVARKYAHSLDPEKSQIISAWNSFHGRTIATLTATGQPHYHEGFGPLPDGFTYVHYNDLAELESMMSDKTCAVLLETIQGEGGVYTPAPGYLEGVRKLCDKYHALLIFDEIQAGIGRSGKFFAYEKYGVKPDVVTLAKGLAGGVPIGAFLTTDAVASTMKPGDHGTTFGGNPLACAAANVVLDTVPQPEFLQHVETVGSYFKAQLLKLQEKYPTLIKEVRGTGLILGAELTIPGRDIVNDVLAKGAIINCTAGNVLRFIPPLIITEEQVDEVLSMIDDVLPKYC
ncbi:aspartate aminotransferase family protein [uncultured Selenomonas sp.]|uniref:aspartate aminotransferase family protein n=1 Tax=uncultured Selenomonas sp. TaxID=159275 RepID=UPI0025CC882E|nr:aspartate aminotransferase family protein [uncultured Selenomonas sp.]